MNSLIRIFGDPYLKQKLYQILCQRQDKYDQSLLQTARSEYQNEDSTETLPKELKRIMSAKNPPSIRNEEILSQIDKVHGLYSNQAFINRFSDRDTLFGGESKIPLLNRGKLLLSVTHPLLTETAFGQVDEKARVKMNVPTFVYLQEKNSVKVIISFSEQWVCFQNLKTMFASIGFHFTQLNLEHKEA